MQINIMKKKYYDLYLIKSYKIFIMNKKKYPEKSIYSSCDFSYRHYKEILNLLKKQKYKFCFFSNRPGSFNLNNKTVYLRHDIDFSPKMALSMAKLEYQKNISSTYFIRLAGSFYNVFEPKNAKIIQEITSYGHQLGLHFEGDIEVNLFGKDFPSVKIIEQAVEKQIKTLQKYFKTSTIISFHCPHLASFVIDKQFKNFISTYSPDFFSKTKYLSDSAGTWQKGCACRWLTTDKLPANLHLLIHPFWWGRTNLNANDFYYQKLQEKFKELDLISAKENPYYKRRFLK